MAAVGARALAAAVAAAAIGTTAAALTVVGSGDEHVAGACTVREHREALPRNVTIGEVLEITTSLDIDCSASAAPLRVAFVVDASEQMVDRGRNWLPDMLADLEVAVRGAGLARHQAATMAVVSFRDRTADIEVHLTNSPDDVARGLHDIVVRNGLSCPQCGLREGLRKARRVIQAGREASDGEPGRDVIVIASRGFDPVVCDAVRAATNELRPFGVLVVTACGGGGCERRCLSEAASSPEYAFSSGDWGYVDTVVADLVSAQAAFHPVESVNVEDRLASILEYRGGGQPDAVAGNALSWTFRPATGKTFTRTYSAAAARVGSGPVSESASATLRWRSGATGAATETIRLAAPEIVVAPPETPAVATATATAEPGATSPTGTAGAPPSETPEDAPSATATGQDGPRPARAVHLPLVSTGACAVDHTPLDLALLIDVSGSMSVSDVPPFMDRWSAAGTIAEHLVVRYAGPSDRVAVIPFAAHAEVWAGFDDDRQTALDALTRLPKWDGSRLEEALAAARDELARGAALRPGGRSALVLLTDGELNQTSSDALEERAAELRRAHVRFFAVGLGSDADVGDLARLTGSRATVLASSEVRPAAMADSLGARLRCLR